MTPRLERIAAALRNAGFPIALEPRMGAWMKTHESWVTPVAYPIYAAGGDNRQLRTAPELVALMLAAVRENFAVLRALGVPITPRRLRVLRWVPARLLVHPVRFALATERVEILAARHANAARDEMAAIAAELRDLARHAGSRLQPTIGCWQPPSAGSCALTATTISALPDVFLRATRDAGRSRRKEVSKVPSRMFTRQESRAFAVPHAAAVLADKPRFGAVLRRFRSERTTRRWIVAWLGASVLGIVNGGIRDFGYEERVGESTAGQISTGTLIALLALYFGALQRRWPLASRLDALSVGAIWVALTVLFEFGFGRAAEGLSWGEMLEPYDVTEGNVWILVLVWIAAGPATVRAIAGNRSTRAG